MLRRRQYRAIKDILDVARFTPGVNIDNPGTNNITIRGIASTGDANDVQNYIPALKIEGDLGPVKIRFRQRSARREQLRLAARRHERFCVSPTRSDSPSFTGANEPCYGLSRFASVGAAQQPETGSV